MSSIFNSNLLDYCTFYGINDPDERHYLVSCVLVAQETARIEERKKSDNKPKR